MESITSAVAGTGTMSRSRSLSPTTWSPVLSARVSEVGSPVRTSGGRVPVSEVVVRSHVYLASVATRVLDVA